MQRTIKPPAIQAIDEDFNDLEAHMIAVMASMQNALHTVLKHFDPTMLEQDFEQREKGKSFPLGRKKQNTGRLSIPITKRSLTV